MIYRFQPFSVDKQLGKVYNAHCSMVPNPDDWIQIMDWDCMMLTTQGYELIDRAINSYPDTAIFGAMTNRVGLVHQRVQPIVDLNDSIRHHTEISKKLLKTYASGRCKSVEYVAGFFMLFKKSYWINNNFQENIINSNGALFDWVFCRKAKLEGKPVRVIEGLYVWHTYRLMYGNPLSKQHLR